MAFRPCFACGEKFPGKAATLYGAWMGDEDRVSYTMKCCVRCVDRQLSPLVRSAIRNGYAQVCCVDERDITKDGQDHLYLTAYLPKREMEQYDLVGCIGCLTPTKAWFEEYGLWNQRKDLGGPQGPADRQDLPWDAVW